MTVRPRGTIPLVVVVDLTMQRAFPVAFAFDGGGETDDASTTLLSQSTSYDNATNGMRLGAFGIDGDRRDIPSDEDPFH